MNVIGTVSYLIGKVVAISSDGTERTLMLGDPIYEDELIRVSPDASIELAINGAEPVLLEGGQNWLVSSETFQDAETFDVSEAASDVDSIQAAILAGADPTEVGEATAAGGEPGAGGEGNEGSSTVNVARTAEEVDPTAGYDTIGFEDTFTQPEEELLVSPLPSVSVAVGIEVDTPTDPSDPNVPDVPNEEYPVIVSGNTVTILEGSDVPGNEPTLNTVTFQLILDKVFTTDVTVTFALVSGTATYGADWIDGDDPDQIYTEVIPAGSTAIDVDIHIVEDKLDEGNETVDIVLLSADNATINPAASSGTVVIYDDDTTPVAIDDANSISDSEEPSYIVQGNVLTNDTDEDGDDTSNLLQVVTNLSNDPIVVEHELGTLTIEQEGDYQFELNEAGITVLTSLDDEEDQEVIFVDAYQVTDGFNEGNTADLIITLSGKNEPPTITTDSGEPEGGNDVVYESGLENGSAPSVPERTAEGTFSIGDTDGLDDISSLTIAGTEFLIVNENFSSLIGEVVSTSSGQVEITSYADGEFGYAYILTSTTVDEDEQAETDSFDVVVSDGDESSSVTITIEIVDDVPTAADDGTSTAEDTAVTLNVLANDTQGADGATVTSIVSTTGTGSAEVVGDDSVKYTPAGGEEGSIDIVYEITDADGDTSQATLSVLIGADSEPNPGDDSSSVDEAGLPAGSSSGDGSDSTGGTVSFNLGNDTLASVSLDGQGQYGTFSINDQGAWTYTLSGPITDGEGVESDSVTYTVTDSDGSTGQGTLSVSIVDDVPTAADDGTSTAEDTAVTLNVLANDTQGADGATVTSIVSTTGAGSAEVVGDDSVKYTPAGGEEGSIDIVYEITDADGDTSQATLSVLIGADSEPNPGDDSSSVDEAGLPAGSSSGDGSDSTGGTVSFNLGNDTLASVSLDGQGQYGTFSINDQGAWTYTLSGPITDGEGVESDSVTYTVTDSDGSTGQGTLSVSIVDDVPTAADDGTSTAEDTAVTLNVLANDTQGADGATVTSIVSTTGAGSAEVVGDDSVKYTPAGGEEGSIDIVYEITDADGDTSQATLSVLIGADSEPNPGDDSSSVDEAGLPAGSSSGDGSDSTGGTVSFNLGNDTLASVSLDGQGQYGTFSINDQGAWTYTLSGPITDGEGVESDSVTYTVTDSDGSTGQGTLSVSIVDDVPTAADDGTSTAEDTAVTLNVLANDTQGADGATVTSIVSTTGAGSAEVVGDDSVKYTPAGGEEGSIDIVYEITDADGDTSQATLSVLIGADSEPNPGDDSSSVDEAGLPAGSSSGDGSDSTGGTVSFNLGNDTLASVSLDGQGQYGTFSINDQGAWTYTLSGPITDGEGVESDSVTYTVTDSDGSTGQGTLSVSIVDDVPTAADDGTSTAEDTAVTLNVLANDTQGADGATVTSIVSTTGAGSAEVVGDDSVKYTPAGGEEGSIDIVYEITDADGDTSQATLSVLIGADSEPNPGDDSSSVDEAGLPAGSSSGDGSDSTGGTVSFNLGNDTLASVSLDGQGQYGTFSINDQGAWTYTLSGPITDGEGVESDSVTYTVTDSDGSTGQGTLSVSIVDDVPTAADDGTSTAEDTAVTLNVLANDTQGADGATVTSIVSTTGAGSAEVVGDDSVKYTPAGGEEGSIDIVYEITDADGDTSQATLSVLIGADSEPNPGDDSSSVDEAGLPAGSSSGDGSDSTGGTVSFNLGNDTLASVSLDGQGQYGTFSINDQGAWTYTLSGPITDGEGVESDSVTYTVTDSDGSTGQGTLSVSIVDDVPTAADDGTSTAEDTAVTLNVLANDTQGADGATVTSIVSTTGAGSAEVVGDDSVKYTPAGGEEGSIDIVYEITDADGDTSQATLSVLIGADSEPNPGDDSSSVDEAGLPAGSSSGDGSDSTGGTVSFNLGNDTLASVSLDGQGQYGTFSINDQGAWTYTLSGPITDGEGVESDSVTYTVTDSDGSTGQGTLSVSIVDDIPSNIEPDGTFILNVVDETALNALDIDGDIDNNYGADQGGTVKFNIANATDSGMTSALAPIYFYLSSDGMTLIGSTYFDITNDPQPLADDADVLADKVFTVELSPSGNPDDYSFTLHKAVDGGVSGFNTELGSWDFQGGNTDFAFYTDLSGSDLPSVLLTPTGISGERINGTASEAGVTGQGSGGGGQNIGLNEGIRVDYVENVGGTPTQTAYDEGNPAHTFDDHVVVNGAEATFAISSGTSTVMIEAFDDLDGNDVGDGTSDNITKITINGTAFTMDDDTTLPGYDITFVGNTVQISGIQDDDSVVVFTDDGFTSLEYHYVDNDPDDSTFALGGFGASTLDPGEQVVFDLALELTDADGDTASGSINVVLAPEATTDLGTIGDDILIGSGLDDVIYAGLGDDSLTGGAGNDILSGGEGEDLFIWNTADLGDAVTPAEDVIKDFSVAENDVIDLSNVLGDGTSYDIDAVEVDGVMQLQISNNSAEIVQTINVESISVIDDSDAQTQLANLLASNNIDDGMI